MFSGLTKLLWVFLVEDVAHLVERQPSSSGSWLGLPVAIFHGDGRFCGLGSSSGPPKVILIHRLHMPLVLWTAQPSGLMDFTSLWIYRLSYIL